MATLVGGLVLALLLLGLGLLIRKALRGAWAVLRSLWQRLQRPHRGGVTLRALRLSRSRAYARFEGERAALLAAEVARLRVELRLARIAPAEPRFQRAKREFARRFHPDRLPPRSPDRRIRVAMFQEYWAVLRGIERDG
ncbi:hypothetical protein HB662_21895 [Roseomonas frigidaquae]|uniref:J domain-containing protein n=1 Tax=Falsiroseomonas frigidaquae TaxID=487318 RepID=A0ABX1F5C4_9PROT|nr:hypothetical protein [Falsiroseomonas frigidaquae]NKE47446.1 hypothetical protein [Falsiroseomonas frigidaquae]